jgi:hypothetical protein
MKRPWRVYFVYQHELFAQGIRSLLGERRAITFVGMGGDLTQALEAVSSILPDIILIEERTDHAEQAHITDFLHCARAGRVLTVSLDRPGALVYTLRRFPTATGPDLFAAISGSHLRQAPPANGTRGPLSSPMRRGNAPAPVGISPPTHRLAKLSPRHFTHVERKRQVTR